MGLLTSNVLGSFWTHRDANTMNICFDCWLQIYFCVLFFMKGLGLGKILKVSMSGFLFPSPEQIHLISNL